MSSSEHSNLIRFGPVRLDPAARTLVVDGAARHLEPKACDLLLLLIEERHRAVSKDELLERIWPGRVVVEGALKRTVGLIRQALDDDPKASRYIRTLHGIGYQFVAELEQSPESADTPLQSAPRAARPGMSLGWVGALIAAALLLLVAFANLWHDVGGTDEGAVRALILPFENVTGDPQLDWVENGLPGLAAHALVEEPGLSLMPVESGQRLARALGVGFESEPEEFSLLRELLGADYLVLGRVGGEPGTWWLDLRILDPDGHLADRRLDAGELAALATDHGYRELRSALLGTGTPTAVRSLSFDPYINETYARAMAARAEGDSSRARDLLAVVARAAPEDLHVRMDLVEVEYRLGERERLPELMAPLIEAVAVDPLSALALRLHVQRGSMADAAGDREAARSHFAKALELAVLRGEHIAEADALRLLGRLASHEDKWEAAEHKLGRALTVFTRSGYEPGRAMTLSHLAQVHWRQGNTLESRRHYELALASFERQGRRDGAASMQGNLANIDFELGDTEGALTRYQAALATHRELGNRSSEVHTLGNLVRTENTLGRPDEARAYADEMLVAADALGDARLVANARMAMAELALGQGDLDDAAMWYDAAGEAFEAAGMRDYAQAARSRQVWGLAEAGRVEQARALYEQHRVLLQEESSAYMRGQVLGAEAALAEAEGRIDESIAHLSAGRETALSAGLATNANWFTARLALQLLRAGRLEEAELWVGRVDDLDASFADAFLVRARHAYERGDFAAAVALKERMREVAGQGWLERNEAQLAAYREALAGGRRLPLDDEI